MGLDLVELVLRFEEEFEIALDDEDASEATTVGALFNLICWELAAEGPDGSSDSTHCVHQREFHALRRALVGRMGVTRSAVSLDARLDDLLPAGSRPMQWRLLEEGTGGPLPPLSRPGVVPHGPLIGLGVMMVLVLWSTIEPVSGLLLLLLACPLWAASAVASRVWPATRLPREAETVRSLVGWMAGGHDRWHKAGSRRVQRVRLQAQGQTRRRWTREEVWERMVAITVDQLGIKPEEVRQEARWVQDLRIG
ncbi:MAG: hypothetical protein HYU66_27810 [Armatimonadetes bacterium]|nr:hypothetical protein [Armatimonadota bacterium]